MFNARYREIIRWNDVMHGRMHRTVREQYPGLLPWICCDRHLQGPAPAIVHPLLESTARISSSCSTSSTASRGIVFQSWLLVEYVLNLSSFGKICICKCPTELAGYAWNANSKSCGLHLTKCLLSLSKSAFSSDGETPQDLAFPLSDASSLFRSSKIERTRPRSLRGPSSVFQKLIKCSCISFSRAEWLAVASGSTMLKMRLREMTKQWPKPWPSGPGLLSGY